MIFIVLQVYTFICIYGQYVQLLPYEHRKSKHHLQTGSLYVILFNLVFELSCFDSAHASCTPLLSAHMQITKTAVCVCGVGQF